MKKIMTRFALFLCLLLATITACKKKADETSNTPEYSSVTDVEGNVYRTVKINGKWWMAENLRTTTYRNGKPIIKMQDTDPDSVWAQFTKGMYCYYYHDNTNAVPFGVLYNWYVISDTNNIAPAGWHVPTDDEWKDVEKFTGMSASDAEGVNWRGSHEADKLKIASPDGWSTYGNVWSNNESGFAAQAGSCRLFNGLWGDPGLKHTGFWWTSSIRSASNEPWYRHLDYKKTSVFRYYGPKSYGMSIRCVKD